MYLRQEEEGRNEGTIRGSIIVRDRVNYGGGTRVKKQVQGITDRFVFSSSFLLSIPAYTDSSSSTLFDSRVHKVQPCSREGHHRATTAFPALAAQAALAPSCSYTAGLAAAPAVAERPLEALIRAPRRSESAIAEVARQAARTPRVAHARDAGYRHARLRTVRTCRTHRESPATTISVSFDQA